MKTLLLIAVAACLATCGATRAADPTNGVPRNLALELTVIRFKPESKDQVLQDFNLSGSSANVVEILRGLGRSVDVVYRGTREVALEPNAMARFDATETRPVILVGKPGVPVPPAAVYGLTLQVTVRPVGEEAFILAWDGSLNWSPDLMDRRTGMQNTFQFLGKAANLAQSASQFAGDSQGAVRGGADIGFAVAELFKGGNMDSSIYELPVLKTVGLNGSRVCRDGQLIVSTTAAEAGVKEPQILFFVLAPHVEP